MVLMALRLFVLAFVLALAPKVPAQQKTETPPPPPREEESLADAAPAVTRHQINARGKLLKYTATAGRLLLKQENGTTEAAVFYTAYTLDGSEARKRPLTFIFNGGPGTSTVWLHLGALGPRKIELEPDGAVPAPPYAMVDNPDTLLDRSDLVFIDAPGTGYSRVRSDLTKSFYNVAGDANAFYRFIRLFITQNQRWGSPLFLFGESYGTTRAAALANHLTDNAIPVNGVVLLSVGLDFQTLVPGNLNDLPYQLLVPTYTMIAAYHQKLAPELAADVDATVQKVQDWCAGEYAQALAKGSTLPPDERKQIAARLAAYSGLKPELVEEYDLRIGPDVFRENLLKERKLHVGRVDGRFTSPRPENNANEPFFDPAMAAMFPAFNAAMNDYAGTELRYRSDLPHMIWNLQGINRAWDWGSGMAGYPQTATLLQAAMAKNKYLKVLAIEGLYDIATPFYASRYTFAHLRISPELRRNISFADFKGGHMVYNDAAVLQEMKRALDTWYDAALRK
jgi:carboxypeptidase C (cathepsin A)